MSRPKDGRRIVESDGVFPYKLHEENRQMVISNFEQLGTSVHSQHGICLGAVLEHCIKEQIPFTLKGSSKFGFIVIKGKSI